MQQYPEFKEFPFMLIDDEMDEAGPNTGGEETEYDPSEDSDVNQELQYVVGEHIEEELEGIAIDAPTTTNQMITRLLKAKYFTKECM